MKVNTSQNRPKFPYLIMSKKGGKRINKELFLSGVTEKYPESLLENRIAVEGNVIGCLCQDMLLLDDTRIDKTFFLTKDGLFYYLLIVSLRNKGFVSIDEVTILSNINDAVREEFNERGGWETIYHLMEVINLKNWETFLDVFYRENIIINLHKDGLDLNTIITIKDKPISMLDYFRKLPSELVLDWLVNRFSSYEIGLSSKVIEECSIDYSDDFIESLEIGEDVGVPFEKAGKDSKGDDIWCLPTLSRQMDGYLDGTFNLICGYSSVGKSTLLITILMAMVNQGKKVVIISNEQKSKVFKVNFMIWTICRVFNYFNLTKKKLNSGKWNETDREYIAKFRQYWNKNFQDKIKFIALEDSNTNVVKKKIREYTLRYGFDFFVYDTMKLDFQNATSNKEYLSLIEDSRMFDSLAKKYNITVLATVQMAIHTQGNLWCDASMLSQSKQIKEVAESMLIMRTVYAEELDTNNKYYFRPYKREKIDDKWVATEMTIPTDRVYRAVFIEKTRSGSNSGDTGTAYLLEYDGQHGIFKEKAEIKPKHGKIGVGV